VFESWFGILGPKDTPRAIVDRINAAVAKVLKEPEVLKRIATQGVEPRPLTPEAFGKILQEDHDEMAKVVKTVGKVD